MKQTEVDMNKVSESHIDTINSCIQFIKQSEVKLNAIDSYCGNMKKSKMPQFDESKLKKCEDKRNKAIKELESIRLNT